ncbi:hypothetical protein DYBT9275_03027 [Dyadobacter sp. CECT 9275]|uniref:TolC family protein n=1 Tax=Dyadobacter helix TaxID=2822344 RepID=A0A916JFB9_9BACT|nr:TolC family protein [Dyadobacter sp. CECT 9275]CAG5003012.1 hypothetical protein DYBT9275_03027 [Dyadobacter sp. CECT 9275]
MRIYTVGFLVFIASCVQAQDTLRLSIQKADSLFLQNNLLLLAEKYQIEATKASEIQAKLWENPELSLELSAYNPSRGFLDVGNKGQKAVSLQQMISTAGKRNKRIALAAESSRMSEYEFYDLIRNLKFELRQIFFESYFLNQTINLLDSQIATLNITVNAFENEYNRNNISLKEVVRLKALLFQLTNNRADILFEIADNQRDIKNLLQVGSIIIPQVNQNDLRRYQLNNNTLASLEEKALASRADLKIAASATRQAELNHQLQKALAVPDLRLGAIYDQASNYVNNYVGVSASMDLPFFNKNQGNIKAAKSQISYYKTSETAKQKAVLNEVDAAVQKVQIAENAFKVVESRFTGQFEQLNKGIYDNFQKRNITLLEFIDFIETYNDSIREYNRLQADRIKVYEELNYLVGEELFN